MYAFVFACTAGMYIYCTTWAPLFFCSFRIECVLFAQLELAQCGGDGEAILFHWGVNMYFFPENR